MPSDFGQILRKTRHSRGLGLREFARRVGKSPAYIVSLEQSDALPGISEETVSSIAAALELDVDRLMAVAEKTPYDLRPESEEEIALFRLIKKLSAQRKRRLRQQLEAENLPSRKQ